MAYAIVEDDHVVKFSIMVSDVRVAGTTGSDLDQMVVGSSGQSKTSHWLDGFCLIIFTAIFVMKDKQYGQ